MSHSSQVVQPEHGWGSNLANQLRDPFTCSFKSRTRWYMRLFWFFLDLSTINAYILESVSPNHVPSIAKTGQQKKRYRSQLAFRKQLFIELIKDHSSRGQRGTPVTVRRHSSGPSRHHYPEELPGTADCVVCHRLYNKRRRTK